MCDFVSWGVMKKACKFLGLKKDQLIWLTDDMVLAKFGEDANFDDYVGHSGLAKYYGLLESDFIHRESRIEIPLAIAKDVNAGRMKRLAAAYGKNAPSWKFTEPSDDPGMRTRAFDLRSLMLGPVPYKIITMNVRAEMIPVFEAIKTHPGFPAGLSEAAAFVQQKLLDPGYNINPWDHTELYFDRFVDCMFTWDALKDQIPREKLSDLNQYVRKHWDSTAIAVYNL